MIQRHKILITLTGETSSINSDLQFVNDYQINNVQGLGGGIVNFSNIRGFLNNQSNSLIINDFFSYLTGSTTTEEFFEIYNSDQKLSYVFNNYYNYSVLSGQTPAPEIIENCLTGTTGITIVQNSNFNYDGLSPSKNIQNTPLSINDSTRDLNVFSSLTTFTNEPSYYIPVFIKKNHNQTNREKIYFDNLTRLINDLIPNLESDNTEDTYNDYDDYNDYY